MRLRKWTPMEDKLLLEAVNEYIETGEAPDYREIARHIASRTPKQCRERYENSLQPDVKRGEWSFDETLLLASIMTQHGQNWAAIKEELSCRTYNAIKKKGRKLLGEIVDRNSIPKGTKTKATSAWSQKEFRALLQLHHQQEDKSNYLNLALKLKTGRAEAEVERQLLQNCTCDHCSNTLKEIYAHECGLDFDSSMFKERWSLWKSAKILKSLEENGSNCFSSSFRKKQRRVSNCSSITLESSSSSASKRRKISTKNELTDLEEISISSQSSKPEQDEDNWFGWECEELKFSSILSHSLCELSGNTPLSNCQGENSLKEFDLSFLLPM